MVYFEYGSCWKEKGWIQTKKKKKKNWPNIRRLENEYTFICFELEQNI